MLTAALPTVDMAAISLNAWDILLRMMSAMLVGAIIWDLSLFWFFPKNFQEKCGQYLFFLIE